MKNYIINSDTLVIMPYLNNYSIIYEKDKIRIIKKRPNNIINFNCKLHGSSYEGRLVGTSTLIGCTYKAPITIDNNMVFFPTTSPRLKECSWINSYNVVNIYYDVKNNTSKINFINNKVICFNVSLNILNNQLLKSYVLESKIKKNIVQNV